MEDLGAEDDDPVFEVEAQVRYLPEFVQGLRVVVPQEAVSAYVIDNSELQLQSLGIEYRNSKDLMDCDNERLAEFGSIVRGELSEGWLKVEVLQDCPACDGMGVMGMFVVSQCDRCRGRAQIPNQELCPPERYRITHEGTAVNMSIFRGSEWLGRLGCGSVVDVLEVVRCEDIRRVRARLVHPAGWMSLENLDDGFRWAVPELKADGPADVGFGALEPAPDEGSKDPL